MKYIILMLTIILIAVTYTLSVSQTQANRLQMHELSFVDSDGQIIHSEIFVVGADLSNYQLPDAPVREGYIFVRWSYDFSLGMPDADIVVYPQYMFAQYNIPATV